MTLEMNGTMLPVMEGVPRSPGLSTLAVFR
jgi:hypothetical protein